MRSARVDHRAIHHGGSRARADALDQVAGVGPGHAALDPVGQPGAERIGEHDACAGTGAAQVAADAGDRAAGAGARDERADAAAGLGEDLGAGRPLVHERIGGIAELIGEEPAVLGREAPRDLLEVVRMAERRVRHDHRRARRAPRASVRLSIDIFSGITHTSR